MADSPDQIEITVIDGRLHWRAVVGDRWVPVDDQTALDVAVFWLENVGFAKAIKALKGGEE